MLTGPTNKQRTTQSIYDRLSYAQAQTMASSGRLSEAAAIKSLEHHEAMKRAHQQLRNLMSQSNQGRGGLAMIKVPVEPPSATIIETQESLTQQPPPPVEYRVVLEDHNCLGNEQGGSQPNCSAIDVANMEALTYPFARLSKTGLGTFDNDEKSCFDRIMAALALIYCFALGMPDAPCQIHGQAITKMKHYVKTLLGTSQNYYSNAGQGSGGSPSLWLFMWVALAAALQTIMVGMTFHSPDGTHKLGRNQDAFVDNTTGGINDTKDIEPSTLADLAQRLHKLAQHWEKLLFASGGRLELNICFYYIICWKWTNGIAFMITNAKLATNIALTCGNDATTTPH